MTARQSRFAMLLLLGAMPGTALATALGVIATSGDAGSVRDGIYNPLRTADAIEPGVHIQTARPGRIELRLEPVGRLALGDGSRVLLHSIDPVDPPARMHLVRLVFENGTLRAGSRTVAGEVPADLRINFGALRMRVFGAEVWMERTDPFDEVCLVAGAVELQTPAGPQRLDEAGSCLRVTAGGLQHLDAAAAGPMEPRLLRTVADRRLADLSRPAPAPAPVPVPATPQPQPQPVSEPAPAVAVAVDAAGRPADDGTWTIVLASLPERARADGEAARLRELGLDTDVIAATRQGGATTWRVVSGRYAQKADAADDVIAIRKRRGLAGAWVTQLP